MASRVAVVTYLLIAVNIAVFLIQLCDASYYDHLIRNYGLVPFNVMEGKRFFTLVTSMFLHADFIHIGLNMLFLLITGDSCERAMGSLRFSFFYITSGVIAGLFHVYTNQTSNIPTIGASGAIFGVLAAFAILFPFRWMISLFGFIPVPVPAVIFVFIAVLSETALITSGAVENVAHTAHLGGFLAGVFLTLLFGPKKREMEEQ